MECPRASMKSSFCLGFQALETATWDHWSTAGSVDEGAGPSHQRVETPLRELIHRFNRLKTIEHPRLCSYTEVVRGTGRTVYLVTEHWSLSLKDVLAQSKLSATETSRIVSEILQGLSYLHSLGIAHGDLRTGNVLIDGDGKVKLSHYGLPFLTRHGTLLRFGALPRDVRFSAPEEAPFLRFRQKTFREPQWVAQNLLSGARQDTWALGVVILEMLQGAWRPGKALILQTAGRIERGEGSQRDPRQAQTAKSAVRDRFERNVTEAAFVSVLRRVNLLWEESARTVNADSEKETGIVQSALDTSVPSLPSFLTSEEAVQTHACSVSASDCASSLVPLVDLEAADSHSRWGETFMSRSASTASTSVSSRLPSVPLEFVSAVGLPEEPRAPKLFFRDAWADTALRGGFRGGHNSADRFEDGITTPDHVHFNGGFQRDDGYASDEDEGDGEEEGGGALLTVQPSLPSQAAEWRHHRWTCVLASSLFSRESVERHNNCREGSVAAETLEAGEGGQEQQTKRERNVGAVRATPLECSLAAWLCGLPFVRNLCEAFHPSPFASLHAARPLGLPLSTVPHASSPSSSSTSPLVQLLRLLSVCLTVDSTERPPASALLSLVLLERDEQEAVGGGEKDDGLGGERRRLNDEILDAFASLGVSVDEIFFWWNASGGDVLAVLKEAGVMRPPPPLFRLPLGERLRKGETVVSPRRGRGKGQAEGEGENLLGFGRVARLSCSHSSTDSGPSSSIPQLLWVERELRIHGEPVGDLLQLCQDASKVVAAMGGDVDEIRPARASSRPSHFLYQWGRVSRFRQLLRELPRQRAALIREASIDIPPLLRRELWPIVLGAALPAPPTAAVSAGGGGQGKRGQREEALRDSCGSWGGPSHFAAVVEHALTALKPRGVSQATSVRCPQQGVHEREAGDKVHDGDVRGYPSSSLCIDLDALEPRDGEGDEEEDEPLGLLNHVVLGHQQGRDALRRVMDSLALTASGDPLGGAGGHAEGEMFSGGTTKTMKMSSTSASRGPGRTQDVAGMRGVCALLLSVLGRGTSSLGPGLLPPPLDVPDCEVISLACARILQRSLAPPPPLGSTGSVHEGSPGGLGVDLQRSVQTFGSLLRFCDPLLAVHLDDIGLRAETYFLRWLVTFFAEVPGLHGDAEAVVDSLIQNPPAFLPCLGVCVVHSCRTALLAEDNPERARRLLSSLALFTSGGPGTGAAGSKGPGRSCGFADLVAAAQCLHRSLPLSFTLAASQGGPLASMRDQKRSNEGPAGGFTEGDAPLMGDARTRWLTGGTSAARGGGTSAESNDPLEGSLDRVLRDDWCAHLERASDSLQGLSIEEEEEQLDAAGQVASVTAEDVLSFAVGMPQSLVSGKHGGGDEQGRSNGAALQRECRDSRPHFEDNTPRGGEAAVPRVWVVDVRPLLSFQACRLQGSIHLPLDSEGAAQSPAVSALIQGLLGNAGRGGADAGGRDRRRPVAASLRTGMPAGSHPGGAVASSHGVSSLPASLVDPSAGARNVQSQRSKGSRGDEGGGGEIRKGNAGTGLQGLKGKEGQAEGGADKRSADSLDHHTAAPPWLPSLGSPSREESQSASASSSSVASVSEVSSGGWDLLMLVGESRRDQSMARAVARRLQAEGVRHVCVLAKGFSDIRNKGPQSRFTGG
uniref:Uncharacterized protein n=1 Tax=Chromera velia CCMP2878 TaxID=1169474 RepID=A0A0G4FIB9_9ALVE|eukprot:Cvel_17128.t1-p1 / transcript=Cvel_17128.t1 / gene=Cvel_17128 / organism=Chromera_velia_CCMP2878 / gene_product=TBC domain-containing protein kinase-like protein, putative / transcript_product=TBC domain-containing protein kinase-like protein, putative / location=Cvel_scaffold1351:34246-41752(-) / protein_length=1651 / sequence_SO=supercontig / SO=protein_coding / is_pseudo=false